MHLRLLASLIVDYAKRRGQFNGTQHTPSNGSHEVIIIMISISTLIFTSCRGFGFCSREVPLHKQRIAGKSIPMEKFVIKKSERFFAQNDRLCLPALELLYVWNFMRIIGKQWSMVESFYHLIERTMKDLERRTQGKFHQPFHLMWLATICWIHSRLLGSNQKENPSSHNVT